MSKSGEPKGPKSDPNFYQLPRLGREKLNGPEPRPASNFRPVLIDGRPVQFIDFAASEPAIARDSLLSALSSAFDRSQNGSVSMVLPFEVVYHLFTNYAGYADSKLLTAGSVAEEFDELLDSPISPEELAGDQQDELAEELDHFVIRLALQLEHVIKEDLHLDTHIESKSPAGVSKGNFVLDISLKPSDTKA